VSDPLSGLDDIDWAGLDSWTTEPENIPGRLRALLSESAEERHEAFLDVAVDLMDSEEHEVFSATVAALPFLLSLVADAGVPDRGRLLGLLAEIGTVVQPDWLLEGFDETSHLTPDEESFPVAHCVIPVRDAVELYGRLLEDPDASVRAGAALLLGAYRPASELPGVTAAYRKEVEPVTRASLLLCLAHYRMGGAELGFELALEGEFRSAPELPKAAAALAMVLIERNAAPEWARDELVRAGRKKKAKVEGLFWNAGRLGDYAARVLQHLRASA